MTRGDFNLPTAGKKAIMTDVLTHALAGYIIGMVLSFRVSWLRAPFVTAVMVGALLPDFTKVSLVLSSSRVESILGTPFDWFALHTPFGVILTAGIGSLLVSGDNRGRVFILLLVGAASHIFLDSLLMSPSRFSYVLFWPFRVVLVPLPMYILSSDRWPAVVAAVIALILRYARRRRDRRRTDSQSK